MLMKTAFAIAITALGLAQLFAQGERGAALHPPAINRPQVELRPQIAAEPRFEAAPRLDESRRNREMKATSASRLPVAPPADKSLTERPRPTEERLEQPGGRREEAQPQQETLQQQTAHQRLSFAEARERMSRERHDHTWWEQRYNDIFRGGTGYYYLDAGYWYPAFGYDPAVDTYASNDPMYAIEDLTPDQEISTVQTALQSDRYYNGSITGVLDTTTLEAIAKFQTDNGLLATGAIDQPTLEAMGLS